MSVSENLKAYLLLAEDLSAGNLPEADLPAAASHLPPLDLNNLELLAARSEQASRGRPRLGWAIAAVADAAAAHASPPFPSALAAWYLARAANEWLRPRRVEAAIQRARSGFAAIGETGWVAACDWQRYAHPWTGKDFGLAAIELGDALKELEHTGCADFTPHCRLSLAYAQILTGNFAAAEQNIAASENDFISKGEYFDQARCWLHTSSLLRRRGRYDKSLAYVEQALEVFERLDAPIEAAKAHFQMGYSQWRSGNALRDAKNHFTQAAHTFEERDLPLWEAQCYGGLAQVYSDIGDLRSARESLQAAREIYSQYTVLGLRADNLLDSGRLEMFFGNPTDSMAHLDQAERLYTSLGTGRMSAIAAMYRGRVYAQFGRYLPALGHLERAQNQFQEAGNLERLAESEIYLAQIWVQLDRPAQAHPLLQQAAGYYRQTGQRDFLASVYNRRAEALFRAGQHAEAATDLRAVLAASQERENLPGIALSHRLLGEALLILDQPDEAVEHLSEAADHFAEMKMPIEQAACQTALGEYYAHTSQAEAARQAWEQALHLSQGIMPDITWRAQAGLAGLAEGENNADGALQAYCQMITALAKMRRGLWQPSLAGSYLRRPAPAINQAIALAANMQAGPDTLHFIEESKAQTVAARFADDMPQHQPAFAAELVVLAAEIRWLQERLRVDFAPSMGLRSAGQSEMISQLRRKNQQYDDTLNRLERQRILGRSAREGSLGFDPDRFRQLATTALTNAAWVALDYYLTEDSLAGVILTPESLHVWQDEITGSVRMALQICEHIRRSGHAPGHNDMAALGEFLLPDELQEHLSGDTTLLIAPHRQLHQIPWAALIFGAGGIALVEACIPVITPSLHSSSLLWERQKGRQVKPQPAYQDGLIVAISDFRDRRRALPQAVAEADELAALTGVGGQVLVDESATWETLLALARDGGLAHFGFWHIASHAFYDPLTGRLSGIALHDRDLWLDHLWDLAPLPPLVTLSACNGAQSLIHEGDEHVGLATTCLAAGAQHVVGSLWPVLDEAAGRLMLDFYARLQAGKRPAQALVLAQRKALRRTSDVAHWGGFLCVGAAGG